MASDLIKRLNAYNKKRGGEYSLSASSGNSSGAGDLIERLAEYNKKRNGQYNTDFVASAPAYPEIKSAVDEAYIQRVSKLNPVSPSAPAVSSAPSAPAQTEIMPSRRDAQARIRALYERNNHGGSGASFGASKPTTQQPTAPAPVASEFTVAPYTVTADPEYQHLVNTDVKRGTSYTQKYKTEQNLAIAEQEKEKARKDMMDKADAYQSALLISDPELVKKTDNEYRAAKQKYDEYADVATNLRQQNKTLEKSNKEAEFNYKYNDAAKNSSDFADKSAAGKSIGDAEEYSGSDLNRNATNKVRYYDKYKDKITQDLETERGAINIYSRWDYLNDDEKSVYDYYIGTGRKDKADEYLNGLDRTLQYRQELAAAEANMKKHGIDKYGSILIDSLIGGASNAVGNLMTLPDRLIGRDITENVNTSALQETIAKSEDKGAEIMSMIGQNIGNQIPAMLSGPAGSIVTGLNAAGAAYREAMASGADEGRAVSYGLLIGASEAWLQEALGGLVSINGGSPLGDKLSTAITNLVSKSNNVNIIKALAGAGDFVGDMAGEALEEYLQALIEPGLKNVILDENNKINPVSEEALEAALSGALMAGFYNSFNIGSYSQAVKDNIEYIAEPYMDSAADVINEGLALPEDSAAHRGAVELQKKGVDNLTKEDIGFQVIRNSRELGQKIDYMPAKSDNNSQSEAQPVAPGEIPEAVQKGLQYDKNTQAYKNAKAINDAIENQIIKSVSSEMLTRQNELNAEAVLPEVVRNGLQYDENTRAYKNAAEIRSAVMDQDIEAVTDEMISRQEELNSEEEATLRDIKGYRDMVKQYGAKRIGSSAAETQQNNTAAAETQQNNTAAAETQQNNTAAAETQQGTPSFTVEPANVKYYEHVLTEPQTQIKTSMNHQAEQNSIAINETINRTYAALALEVADKYNLSKIANNEAEIKTLLKDMVYVAESAGGIDLDIQDGLYERLAQISSAKGLRGITPERFGEILENFEGEVNATIQAARNSAAQYDEMKKAAELTPSEVSMLARERNHLKYQANKLGRLDTDSAAILKDLISGKRSIDSLSGLPAAQQRRIMEHYDAQKALNEVTQKLQLHARGSKIKYSEAAAEFLADSNSWHDKKNGLAYMTETLERNLQDITKNDSDKTIARKMEDYYIAPIRQANADIVREKTKIGQQIRSLNLSQKAQYKFEGFYDYVKNFYGLSDAAMENYYNVEKLSDLSDPVLSESELVQMYGEKLIDKGTLKTLGADVNKITHAADVFSEIYTDLYGRINDAYVRNGYEPMGHIDNYFPHFRDIKAGKGWWKRMGEIFGAETSPELSKLPTDIAGLTDNFKPGRKWNPHALERTGVQTSYDSIKGMQEYLDNALQVIYQTDNIQKLRALEKELRYKYSDESVQRKIAAVESDWSLDEAGRAKSLEEAYSDKWNDTNLSLFAQELRRYTNRLAGKKSTLDRPFEEALGRSVYKTMNKLSGNIAGNMIAMNMGTALTNLAPLTLASGEIDSIFIRHAISDTLKYSNVKSVEQISNNPARKKDIIDLSDFYVARAGAGKLSSTALDNISDVLSKPMELVDLFTAEAVFRAKYMQNIYNGMSQSEAVKNADEYCVGLFASRNDNEMPTLWASKNPFSKAATMFQLEVNNQIRYIAKDLPKNIREENTEKAGMRIAWGLIKILMTSWLANKAKEKITGYGGLFDPVGVVEDAFNDFRNDEVSTGEALYNLGNNILDQLPFVSAFTGGGRVPVLSAMPEWEDLTGALDDIKALISGNGNAGQWKNLLQNVILPAGYALNPVGGLNQVKKTVQGVSTVAKGGEVGYTSDGEKYYKYTVDKSKPVQTGLKYAQAALFGKSALFESQEYYDNGYKRFSVKQSEALDRLAALGAEKHQTGKDIQEAAQIEGDKDADGKTITGSKALKIKDYVEGKDYTPEQEAVMYDALGVLSSNMEEKKTEAADKGISESAFYEAYFAKLEAQTDVDVHGKSIPNSKAYYARKAIDGIEGLDADQRRYLYDVADVTDTVANASDFDMSIIYSEILKKKKEKERLNSVGYGVK